MSLWPKEHGAYGQLAVPLVTSFAVSGTSTAALWLAGSVVAVFLAHEPLLVLLGRRGGRAARDLHRRAMVWLSVTGILATVAATASIAAMPEAARVTLLWPLVPALVLGVAIATGHEKSAIGETSVALACSLVAVPLGLAAGAPSARAFAVALVFASIFVACTLAVRGIVLSARGGGQPLAMRRMRALAVAVSLAAAIGLGAAAMRAVVPWIVLAAAAPGLVAACWLTLRPPPPSRLRRVGWTIVAVSMAAALILVSEPAHR